MSHPASYSMNWYVRDIPSVAFIKEDRYADSCRQTASERWIEATARGLGTDLVIRDGRFSCSSDWNFLFQAGYEVR
jgi:hypothetical protein